MTIITLGIFFLLLQFVISNNRVSGVSMQPNFEDNDRLVTWRNFSSKHNDVVVLRAPKTAQDVPGALYVKRIIGLPGDTIVSKSDQMYINGKLLPEPYLNNHFKKADNDAGDPFTTNFTYKVPQGYYFVMGEYRDISRDSRFFGPIKRSALIVKVIFRYYPFNKIQSY